MPEYKNGKLQLPNVTLVALTSVKIKPTIKAMLYSMRGIDFGDAVLITHEKPFMLPKKIRYAHIDKIDEIDKFNYACVYELGKYIKTDYILLVHYDGFVIHPESWRDEFLDYDYIGSPWPLPPDDDPVKYRDPDGKIIRVGNSVGIRSKKLLDLPGQLNLPWESFYGWYNEDGFLCCHHHKELEAAGCKYAPIEVARYFGREQTFEETTGIKPFTFHKWGGENADFPKFDKTPWIKVLYRRIRYGQKKEDTNA